MPKLLSVQVGPVRFRGKPGSDDPMDDVWSTAFFKDPVAGSVAVHKEHLEGDGQADRDNHGGPDKAVLGYAAAHYPAWQSELGQAFPPGAFGENLTIDDLTEESICVGDVWRVGDVVLEVTQPRQPCWKLGRRWRMNVLPSLVVQNGRSGWYYRVQQTGTVTAGLEMTLQARPNPDWTVARCNRVMHHMRNDRVIAGELAAVPALSEIWRETLKRRAG